MNGFKQILVATDFSPCADAALRQAAWLGHHSGAKLVLSHCVDHLRRAAHSVTYKARLDLLSADGQLFQKEIREESGRKMRQQIADLRITDLEVSYETLLGEPFVEITHAVVLGNTDERVLDTCDCSILTIKSDDYVSPIAPATWPLHP